MNALSKEYPALFTYMPPKKGRPDHVQVTSAARIGDGTPWQIHRENGIYAEVALVELTHTDWW